MPELRDLYTVGDDEDVAALALYRHMRMNAAVIAVPPSKTQTQ
jgi:hypothetical protein